MEISLKLNESFFRIRQAVAVCSIISEKSEEIEFGERGCLFNFYSHSQLKVYK